jgi:hypothetical protein
MHEHFCKSFPTYCGSTTEQKPEGLDAVLKARRIVPSFKHVEERFRNFVAGFNATADHNMEKLIDAEAGGERLSPDEAMARWCTTRRVVDAKALDLILQVWHKPVTVGRNGVTINVVGTSLSYGQFDQALMPFKGKKRRVFVSYDPHALQSVRVYDEKMRFITEAGANGSGGLRGEVGRHHLRRAIKLHREYDQKMRFLAQNPECQYMSRFEIAAQIAAEENRPQRPAPAPGGGALRLIPTPLDEASKDREAAEARKAAGAESMSRMPSLLESLRKTYANPTAEQEEDLLPLSWAALGDAEIEIAAEARRRKKRWAEADKEVSL